MLAAEYVGAAGGAGGPARAFPSRKPAAQYVIVGHGNLARAATVPTRKAAPHLRRTPAVPGTGPS
jgi:hypothetical protein